MAKLTDVAISINTDCPLDNRVTSSFVYNFYEETETVADDKKISAIFSRKRHKNRFIRLIFDSRVFKADDLDEYGDDKNFATSIYNLSLVNNLDKQQLSLFNKIDHIISNRKSLTRTLDSKEASNLFDYYIKNNISESLTKNTFKIKSNSSQRISIKNDNSLNLSDLYINTVFTEGGIADDISNYNNLTFSSSSPKEAKNVNYAFRQGNIFPKLKKLETIISEDLSMEEFSYKNGVKCGFLIEKFVKKGFSIFVSHCKRQICGK